MTIRTPFYFIISACDSEEMSQQRSALVNAQQYYQFWNDLDHDTNGYSSCSSSLSDIDDDYMLDDSDDCSFLSEYYEELQFEADFHFPVNGHSAERQLLEMSRALDKNQNMLARFEEFEEATEAARQDTTERVEADSVALADRRIRRRERRVLSTDFS